MADRLVSRETRDDVQILRLERADQRNALVPELLDQLAAELEAADAHSRQLSVRKPLVLTAAGGTFCPGADLKWLSRCSDPATGVADLVAVHHLVISRLLQMGVPVIAAINGAVAGGGLGLALAADYRLASAEQASFATAYFSLGLTPDGGTSAFLQRSIGLPRTMELLLTNRRLSAADALDWGLVNQVVPHHELLDRAVEVARGFVKVPAHTLRATRQLLDMGGIDTQLQRESVAIRTAALGPWLKDALDRFRQSHPD